MPWRIRVRCAAVGPAALQLDGCEGDTPVGQFKTRLWALVGITEPQSAEQQPKILAGAPPKPLDLPDDEAALSSVLSNGECLIVQLPTSGGENRQGKGKVRAPKTSAGASAGGSSATRQQSAGHTGMVHTLSSPNRRRSGGPSAGVPYVDAGGAITTAPRPSPPKRRRRLGISSEEDISFKLAEATQGAGGVGGKFFRRVFKNAVANQYQVSQAEARLAAVRGGQYTMEPRPGPHTAGGAAAETVCVKYNKGLGYRSKYEEEVSLQGQEEVKAVMQMVYQSEKDREMLSASNMALVSPRMFWSIAKICGGDVDLGIRQLLPGLDWSFLGQRKRELSEKAKRNQEVDALIEAGEIEDPEGPGRRRKRARAAATPAQAPAEAAQQVAPAPSEPIEVDSDNSSDDEDDPPPMAEADRLAALERFAAGVPGASGSPAVDSKLLEAVGGQEAICRQLGARAQISTCEQLAEADAETLAPALGLPEEIVSDWVSAAQDSVLDDVMLKLVGNADVVKFLDTVNISTPRDIVLRVGKFADMLMDFLTEEYPAPVQQLADHLSVENLVKWKAGADRLLAEIPWLESWVSA